MAQLVIARRNLVDHHSECSLGFRGINNSRHDCTVLAAVFNVTNLCVIGPVDRKVKNLGAGGTAYCLVDIQGSAVCRPCNAI